jgi:hypothetical protein
MNHIDGIDGWRLILRWNCARCFENSRHNMKECTVNNRTSRRCCDLFDDRFKRLTGCLNVSQSRQRKDANGFQTFWYSEKIKYAKINACCHSYFSVVPWRNGYHGWYRGLWLKIRISGGRRYKNKPRFHLHRRGFNSTSGFNVLSVLFLPVLATYRARRKVAAALTWWALDGDLIRYGLLFLTLAKSGILIRTVQARTRTEWKGVLFWNEHIRRWST